MPPTGKHLPVRQSSALPPAPANTRAPAAAWPRRKPIVTKSVAPPPKAVEGELAAWPVDFWGLGVKGKLKGKL